MDRLGPVPSAQAQEKGGATARPGAACNGGCTGSRARSPARLHQRVIGLGIVFYGIYLSTLVGTMTRFVLPEATALGGGAAAGAGVGLLTYLVIGTVGVVTGGTGVALGALAMSLIGGGVGAVGAAAGVSGFRALSYPLVSPWFWGPVIGLGIYLIVGRDIQRKLSSRSSD
ncbi:hypothetical protein AVS7_02515 [Acidovorax sp. MR-S7]|nr:hypothetical protein AVS7_02515 [Acidovorax sp. MR-S7]